MDVLHTMLAQPSTLEWWRFFAVLAGLLGLVAMGELIRAVFQWSPGFTRKLVHMSVGILIFFTPWIFAVPLPAIILALVFIVVNAASLRAGWLKSMHEAGKRSYGTVYYPLAFLILVILFWHRNPMILSCSMLALALGDAAGALVGETVRSPRVFRLSADKKSVQGSVAMGVVSFVALAAGISFFVREAGLQYDVVLAAAGVASVTATAWEALSSRGLDNLTIPLSVALVLSCYFSPAENSAGGRMTLGAVLAILIALISYRTHLLTASGSVATFILALIVFGIGGWQWTVPILTFFLSSSLLSRMGKNRKVRLAGIQEKSSTRDYVQVFANGGIAGSLVIAHSWFPSSDWYSLYLGCLAAVTADTWSTEIGLLSRGRTVLITTFEPVEGGRNGGVTWQGTAAAFAGSLLIAGSGLTWVSYSPTLVFIVLAGVGGSVMDSLMGATVQAEYRCPVCGETTERKIHCTDQPTMIVRGKPWITNDVVNWMCGASGLAVMALVV